MTSTCGRCLWKCGFIEEKQKQCYLISYSEISDSACSGFMFLWLMIDHLLRSIIQGEARDSLIDLSPGVWLGLAHGAYVITMNFFKQIFIQNRNRTGMFLSSSSFFENLVLKFIQLALNY